MTTETIQIEMTWRDAAQIIGAALANGTPQGQAMAREELARMAEAADRARELESEAATAREGEEEYRKELAKARAALLDCATLLRYAISPRQSLDRGQAASAICNAGDVLGEHVTIPQAHARDS